VGPASALTPSRQSRRIITSQRVIATATAVDDTWPAKELVTESPGDPFGDNTVTYHPPKALMIRVVER